MERARNISKSMMSYLKRAREHKEFLVRETKEFERGKRHLANMMGLNSNEMTQDDIDEAIKYLFPSGLFDKRSRPVMKHPDLLHAAKKDAQFDASGRPNHYLFYTTKPNYYEGLNKLVCIKRELDDYEDKQLAKGIIDPPDGSQYSHAGRDWLTMEEMSAKFIELIGEPEHEYFKRCLNTLLTHPYSSRAESFFTEYSRQIPEQSMNLNLPELLRDEKTGQLYTELVCRRREHRVQVKTVLNGSGIFDIEGKDILYFDAPYHRRAIFHPLQISNMQDKVDIYAKIVMRQPTLGYGSVAGAIRQAVSYTIAAYVDSVTREKMRLAGLLTEDIRTAERKKFSQEGARRKYTWKKR